MIEFASLWGELGHDSDPGARNTETLKSYSTYAHAHSQNTHLFFLQALPE